MTEPGGGRYEERRESIGSIRGRWRLLFSILFVAQALPGMFFILWLELAWITSDSPVDTVKSILLGIALVGAASVATTGLFVEAQELMLGTRDLINDWLQKRNEAAEARGVEIGEERGEERGMKRGLIRAQDWYNRRQAALEKGEPFDEPPPWETRLKQTDELTD